MLRTMKSHDVAIVCLNWAEDDLLSRVHYCLSHIFVIHIIPSHVKHHRVTDVACSREMFSSSMNSALIKINLCLYWKVLITESFAIFFSLTRMSFYPMKTAPHVSFLLLLWCLGGLSSGDTGLADENEEAIPQFCSASCQRFNILCSGGKDGCVCFSIFGIFPVGKIVSKWMRLSVGIFLEYPVLPLIWTQ